MNSSLKATVLEYIYKWTEKGWDIQQVSELYLLPMRQTQDKLEKASVPTRVGNMHSTYMNNICRAVGFAVKDIYSSL